MKYKIVAERKQWQRICDSLLHLRGLSRTDAAYGYVCVDRRLRSAAERLVFDLGLDDNVVFVDSAAQIPDDALAVPNAAPLDHPA